MSFSLCFSVSISLLQGMRENMPLASLEPFWFLWEPQFCAHACTLLFSIYSTLSVIFVCSISYCMYVHACMLTHTYRQNTTLCFSLSLSHEHTYTHTGTTHMSTCTRTHTCSNCLSPSPLLSDRVSSSTHLPSSSPNLWRTLSSSGCHFTLTTKHVGPHLETCKSRSSVVAIPRTSTVILHGLIFVIFQISCH